MKNHFDVTKTVSPSIFGGELKNQDRVSFDYQTYTACVCDGTTSSPFAEQAASIVSRCSPMIIKKDVKKNLEAISNLLMAHRNMAIKKGVQVSKSLPESMRTILEEAANNNLKKSFQTTLVCTVFEQQQRNILAKVVYCGDSGFFAFSPDGQMLLSNLSQIDEKLASVSTGKSCKIHFAPGTELLTKIIGPLSKFPILAERTDVSSMKNWIVCSALCLFENSEPLPKVVYKTAIELQQNELLVVPKYMFSMPKDPMYKEFRRLHYSKFIRRLSSPVKISTGVNFDTQGNTTAVLPDHYYTGKWDYFEERFALDTNFLLCSDGFYHAFLDTAEMWNWLNSNDINLTISQQKKLLLNELHNKLNNRCGDDDISFIWIRPKSKRKS